MNDLAKKITPGIFRKMLNSICEGIIYFDAVFRTVYSLDPIKQDNAKKLSTGEIDITKYSKQH